eukprot:gene9419-1626_t
MKIKPTEETVIEPNTTSKKMNVTVKKDEIIFGDENSSEKISISFQRTLRIPDDDKIYPLPPSLGPFPVEKVDDYLDKVPEEWKNHGGVFIPMYQREAMWMKFNGSEKSPKAVKVAIGKVNALSGKTWNQNLKKGDNDYVVIPNQPWLDGINAGDGTVRQFVAMPLGGGYTVEGQVTGKEEFGGIQLCVYDKKDKKLIEEPIVDYPIEYPEEEIPIMKPYPKPHPKPPKKPHHPKPVPKSTFGKGKNIPFSNSGMIVPQSTPSFKQSMPVCDMAIPESYDFAPIEKSINRSKIDKKKSKPISSSDDFYVEERQNAFSEAKEMGLASGGKMKQKIYRDQFGVDFWDENNFGRVYVHIVNSTMYSKITGKPLPDTPISAQTYNDFGYAWYDLWDEGKSDIKKSNILSNVKSVKEIDQEKYGYSKQNDNSIKIENVVQLGKKNQNEIRDGDW